MANLIRRRRSPVTSLAREVGPFDDWFSPRALRREIDQLFENFFTPSAFGQSTELAEFTPTLDVTEGTTEYVMRTELPGMTEKDVHVEVDDANVLTIRGEKRCEESNEEKGYLYSERSYGQFTRSIQLPGAVDATKIAADYKDGVLELHIPKTEEKHTREIPIGKPTKVAGEVTGNGSRSQADVAKG